jgi:hypothetical protein
MYFAKSSWKRGFDRIFDQYVSFLIHVIAMHRGKQNFINFNTNKRKNVKNP